MDLHWSKVAIFYQIKSEKPHVNYDKIYIVISRIIIRKIILKDSNMLKKKDSNMVILNYMPPTRFVLGKYISC